MESKFRQLKIKLIIILIQKSLIEDQIIYISTFKFVIS